MTKKILAILETIGGIASGLLFCTIMWQVLARVVFHVAATWTVEVGKALFVIMIFTGSPILIYRDGHMAIKTILEKLAGKKQNILRLVIDFFVVLALIILGYGCYNRTINTWNDIIPTVEWLTSGKIYLVMFIGTLAMLYMEVVTIKEHILCLKGKEEEKK